MQEYIQDTDGCIFATIYKRMGRGDLEGLKNCIKILEEAKKKGEIDKAQKGALKLTTALRKNINLLKKKEEQDKKNKVIAGIIKCLSK